MPELVAPELAAGDGGRWLGFGIQLPVQAQSRIFVEGWEVDAGVAELAQVARCADEHGYLYLGVCDHTAVPRERAGKMGTTWWDTIATLGFLAGITSQVRLLSHVYIAAHRHPLDTAKAFATLDTLSEGRVVLGVGAGHVAEEFDLHGEVAFADRGAATDEVIAALCSAFADEFPDHAGERWSFRDLGQRPRPVQPHLPIWVGGSSAPALRRAALLGDGWLPQGTLPDQLPEAVATLRRLREDADLDGPFAIGAMALPLYVGDPTWDVGPWTRTGPADQHVEELQRLRDAGAHHAQVRLRSRSADELCDQLASFAADIAPHIA